MTSENESSSGNELEIIIDEDDINEHDKSISSSGSDEADEGSSDDDNNNENTDEDIQDPAEPDDDIQGKKKPLMSGSILITMKIIQHVNIIRKLIQKIHQLQF